MGKALTTQERKDRDLAKREQAENTWLNRVDNYPMDTPREVTTLMGRVFRAYCNGILFEDTYKLLFAGLKEIRAGREQELIFARQGQHDSAVPFVGLTLVFSPEKQPKIQFVEQPRENGHDEQPND